MNRFIVIALISSGFSLGIMTAWLIHLSIYGKKEGAKYAKNIEHSKDCKNGFDCMP